MASRINPAFKANILDPMVHMILNDPGLFPRPAHTSDQESSSSAQGSAAQPDTRPKIRVTTMDLNPWGYTGNASQFGVGDVGESEQTFPNEFSESKMSDGYKGASPVFNNDSPPPKRDDVEFDHDSDAETGTPSKSKEGKAEPSLSELMKLAEKHDDAPDKENQQSSSDLLPEPPASPNKSFAKRSTSPPLNHALAQRASILGYKKPSASRLRNEIDESPADDEKLVQIKGKEPIANANFRKRPQAPEERATDETAIPWLGKLIDGGRFDEPAADAQLLPKSKADRGGVTKETTWVERTKLVQGIPLKGSIADKNSLIPPIVLLNEVPGTTNFIVRIPTPSDQLPELRFRASGNGLSSDEWTKIPHEFRHFHQLTLAKFWDLAYNPIVRKTFLDYKQKLALAGKADKVLDWANKLLATLVDIHEADVLEAANSIFYTGNIEKFIEKFPLDLSISDELLAALAETKQTLDDPSYDTTTAREKFALLKGVKFDSRLTKRLIHFYKELESFHNSSKMVASSRNKKYILMIKLNALDLVAFSKGKGEVLTLVTEDMTLATEDAKTSNGKGENVELVAETATDKGKGKGKENDSPATNTTISKGKSKGKGKGKGKNKGRGKGKGKEGELLVEGPATDTGKGKGKENDLPVNYLTIGEDKGKESDEIEAARRQANSDMLREAKKLWLGSKADEFRKAMARIFTATPDNPRGLFQSPLTMLEAAKLIAYSKTLGIMDSFIRPQTGQIAHVEVFCSLLAEPDFFAAMALVVEELSWDRAVVEHPNNPLISCILQRTAHLRPTNGLTHSSGISVAPLLTPQLPPLPPGPPPTTQPTTEKQPSEKQPSEKQPSEKQPREKQPREKQPREKQLREKQLREKQGIRIPVLEEAQIPVHLPFGTAMEVLEQREKILVAKAKSGTPLDSTQMLADFFTIGSAKEYLRKKDRLDNAGGRLGVMLAERQKKMAEQDGAPTDSLP